MSSQTGTYVRSIATVLVASLAYSAAADQAARQVRVAREDVSRKVEVNGVDLSSIAGAQRLYREIVLAAKDICSGSLRLYEGAARSKHEREHVRQCFDQAVDRAVLQVTAATGVDIEMLSALDRFATAGLRASR